jgi:16S rRNA (cytidine1402-2'-O)-methyltransferase
MDHEIENTVIEQGTLYIVATPIGNRQDLSPRAEAVLRQVALIGAEDTRHSRPLLQHFGIQTPLKAVHQHNEEHASGGFIQRLLAGDSLALISDAGTPLVSDPGLRLVSAAHAAGVPVRAISGPSAVISALSVAGLPADQFVFAGFIPSKAQARTDFLKSCVEDSRTQVFYEAPHRILASIQSMQTVFGVEREAVLVKELSKCFETAYRANLVEIEAWLKVDLRRCKGEFVVIIAGAKKIKEEDLPAEASRILHILAADLPLKQAARLASDITGIAKNHLYQLGLEFQKQGK